ncbi:tetratricopeptide repeat protein [Chitinivorax sp. PXF-14]|uniref:tetratricopeptide repeat protein n=1 Tax=Chitinivorax sp. PXF-14 TaxID=3230488 RepID=UPI003466218E
MSNLNALYMQIQQSLINGRLAEAAMLATKAHTADPEAAETGYYMAIVSHRMNKYQTAHRFLDEVIARAPEYGPAWLEKGRVYYSQGDFEASLDPFFTAWKLMPNNPAVAKDLGLMLVFFDRFGEAIPVLRVAAAQLKQDVEVFKYLGIALCREGNVKKGLATFEAVIPGKRSEPGWHTVLGQIYLSAGLHDMALKSANNALEIRSDFYPAYDVRNAVLQGRRQHDALLDCYDKLLARQVSAPMLVNKAVVLVAMGRYEEARQCYEQAVELEPDNHHLMSSFCGTSMYMDSLSAQQVFELHQRYGRLVEACTPLADFADRPRDPKRKLRIGYVSADFNNHAVAKWTLGMFRELRHDDLDVYVYYNNGMVDDTTREFMRCADAWRQVDRMPDSQLASLIVDDMIDILVDVSVHTQGHRLPVFARKPAPIQVSWVGVPNTSGLTRIDYRLTDAYFDPVGKTEHYNTETLWRMPDTLSSLDWDVFVEPGPLPALENGYVTFGAFNRLGKMSRQSVAFWSQVLKAVPDSKLRLIVLSADGKRSSQVDGLLAMFASFGIGEERLQLEGGKPVAEFYKMHDTIDIQLDTYPYSGSTTTAISLGMGVPVVGFAGEASVSRASSMVVSNVGHPEWVVETMPEAVDVAVRLAADLDRLAALRAGLPDATRTSPLFDSPRFARNMEQAFREMWLRYCDA